jgi:hypothetical protein
MVHRHILQGKRGRGVGAAFSSSTARFLSSSSRGSSFSVCKEALKIHPSASQNGRKGKAA